MVFGIEPTTIKLRGNNHDNDKVIDSRDVIARIEELEDLVPDHPDEILPGESIDVQNVKDELKALKELSAEASTSPDWQCGEVLIHNDYFTEYTKELIRDCYEMPKEFESGDWPWRHMEIDYEAAAQEEKQDYRSVSFGGEEYWIRA